MIKPLEDRVLIKIKQREEITKSGIILKNSDKEEPRIGEIIAVGPGEKNIEMYVKEKEHVIVDKYVGVKIKYEGEEYFIVKQSDILAIID